MGNVVLSDIHTELGYHPDRIKKYINHGSDTIVLAGDIGNPFTLEYKQVLKICSTMYKNVVVVTGNHEYYTKESVQSSDQQVEHVCKEFSNVYFLQKTAINLDVDSSPVRFIGCTLWSDITKEDFKDLTDNKYIQYEEYKQMHSDHVQWLTNELQHKSVPTVVVTHHVPSEQGIHVRFFKHTGFSTSLDHLFTSPVKLWVCGHTHESIYTKVNHIPLVINPIGYRGEYKLTLPTKIDIHL